MYQNPGSEQLEIEFSLPFGGHLKHNNRWVVLAHTIPWHEFEAEYASQFSKSQGAPSLSFRIALGSLIIKERLRLSDEETVETIAENPYLQYFLGYKEFQQEHPFHSSMMTHFRKRITPEMLERLNDRIIEQHNQNDDDSNSDSNGSGTLIVDATCTPADVRYPTDTSLLNEAREKSEAIIDTLWNSSDKVGVKPRTYRRKARKSFLNAARSKRLSAAKRRKAVRKQLNFLRRNIATIEAMGEIEKLSSKQYRQLLVISEVYRQQQEMYDQKKHSISDRIVSVSQSHVRPIVRGKVGKSTEFGAKISAAVVDGFAYLDRISFDSYNESEDLPSQIESYKKRYGCYPKKVLADQIYKTRKNRAYCKEKGILLSGKPLGRPPRMGYSEEQKAQWRNDECERVPVEGKFGQLKRKYSLGRVMAKLAHTSEVVIRIAFLVVNLMKIHCLQIVFPIQRQVEFIFRLTRRVVIQ